MASYILDSTTLSLLQWGNQRIQDKFTLHKDQLGHTVGITSVNVEESIGGWYTRLRQAKSRSDEALASVQLANAVIFLAGFPIYPLTITSLNEFDRLLKQKLKVGRNDLRIAALALELGATVVTNNLRDFTRVPGLQCVDWAV
jgi:tRNA(fMet)-specific endonuclease VapC